MAVRWEYTNIASAQKVKITFFARSRRKAAGRLSVRPNVRPLSRIRVVLRGSPHIYEMAVYLRLLENYTVSISNNSSDENVLLGSRKASRIWNELLLRTAKTGCQVRVVGIGLVRGRVCSG
jgi:hypothetical protein